MKKLILSVTAVAGLSMASFAQGTITFDGSNNTSTSPTASSNGQVFINGVLDTSTDINAELLYSTTGSGGVYTPVVTLLLSSINTSSSSAVGQTLPAAGDITFNGNGTFYDANGIVYSLPGTTAGGTAYFEVEAWLGNSSTWAGATTKNQANTIIPFLETVNSSTSPNVSVVDQMPALNLTAVPEPSTLAMAGVGLASMLIFRRRNK
jgi:hypothetical protein